MLGIIHLRTMHLGPDDLLVAAKVDFDHGLDNAGLAQAIDEAERSPARRRADRHARSTSSPTSAGAVATA